MPLREHEIRTQPAAQLQKASQRLKLGRSILLSFSPDDGMLRIAAVHNLPAAPEGSVLLASLPTAVQAFEYDETVDADPHDLLPPQAAALLAANVIGIPLLLNGRRMGMLVGELREGASSSSPVWRAQVPAATETLALSLEIDRLETANRELTQQTLRTRDIAAAMIEQRSVGEILELMAQHLEERFDIDRIAVYCRGPQGTQTAYRHRVSEEYTQAVCAFAPSSPFIARAHTTHLPIVVNDIQKNHSAEPIRSAAEQEAIVQIVLIPLQYKDEIIGTIGLYPRTQRAFTPADMVALKIYGDQTSVAVTLARMREQQVEAAILDERNRLAREFHDTLAQSLATLVMQLDTAQALIDHKEQLVNLLHETQTLVREALDETRRAVLDLGSGEDRNLPLAQLLDRDIHRFGERTGIKVHFAVLGEEREIAPDIRTACHRIVREALHNIEKHAHASRVRAALEYHPDAISAVVEDDGTGFNTQADSSPDETGGFGLTGMRDRAHMLGGSLQIESRLGWGTRITLQLPTTTAPRQALQQPGRIRVLLADDHALFRRGLRTQLEEAGMIITAEAEDGAEALRLAAETTPDVLVLDMHMPRLDGLSALQQLQETNPKLPVLVLSSLATETQIAEALKAGARGYLNKDTAPAEIVQAVQTLAEGRTLLSEEMAERLLRRLRENDMRRSRLQALNPRETEILRELAAGARNREIAARLFITEKTVEFHLTNIFAKLNVNNRTEAARIALEEGLLPQESPTQT
jgi:DNA-binding NarL/FixJ family response regulator/signal transduction histidine kinase